MLVVLHHGRKLLHVAYEEQLHTSERQVMPPESSEHQVHSVQHIGTHHAYLVDDQKVKSLYYAYLVLIEPVSVVAFPDGFRHERSERQLEERVQRHAASVYGSHACWRSHDDALAGMLHHILQECRLACAGTTSQKNVSAGVLHKHPCHSGVAVVVEILHSPKRKPAYIVHIYGSLISHVRMIGLEPTSLTALDPKSSASTNFATSA